MHSHELDIVSLTGGVLAAGGALLYLADADVDARWVVALALVTLGLAAVASALRSRQEQ